MRSYTDFFGVGPLGLMLIENLMDTVYIESSEHGTTLVMSKNRK